MAYNQVTPEFVEELKKIAGDRVITGADINPDYSRDEMPIYGTKMPDVTIDVQSTEEVAAIMKLCYENNIPVTARGAGTGLVGGCVPVCGGVVLCTMKMKEIIEYDLENMVVRVQPGVLLNDLAQDALTHGLMYCPDPGEKFATLGGNVSTNAGGMRAVKYGATRDYVRAMTLVLPTGEVLKLGAPVSKTSSGYSLINLIIGSEGTLGIITELTLKLIPAPKCTASLVCPYVDLATAIKTVPEFKKAHMNPQALEFFEREILISSEEFLGRSVFPREIGGQEVGAYILCTFDANTEEELESYIEQAVELVIENGALEDIMLADTPAKIKDAWAARSSFLEGIEEQVTLLDECDVVVPVTKIPEFVIFTNEIGKDYDFKVKMFGHAGDGNLHIYTCSGESKNDPNAMPLDEFEKQVDDFMTRLYAKTTELGGQISGEHAIGYGKVKYLMENLGPVNIRLQQEIKKVFDPKLILNPGKVCYKL